MHPRITIRACAALGAAAALLLLLASCGRSVKDTRMAVIGAGAPTGIYYPAGGAIARIVNATFLEHRLKVTILPTYKSSTTNLNNIIQDPVYLGFAQADDALDAYAARGEWASKPPAACLRSVFALHTECLTLVASEESGIKALEDIRGKRVRVSNPDGCVIQNVRYVLEAAGIPLSSLRIVPAKAEDCPSMLQNGELDAFFFMVGHPNGNTVEATIGHRKARLIPIPPAVCAKVVDERPHFTTGVIPKEFYPAALNEQDVPTIGVRAVLLANSNRSDEAVYQITKEVFNNFDEFKNLNAALKNLSKEDLVKGVCLPVHSEAMRYFREAGLDSLVPPDCR